MKYTAVIFDFEGTLVDGNNAYDDARILIHKLTETGIKLGIASNTSTRSIIERLEKNQLLHYFDTIVGIDQVAYSGKPAPDLFITAAEKLGCTIETCLVIEDSESGAEGAHRAGMDVIVVRGEKSNHALLECKNLESKELDNLLFG